MVWLMEKDHELGFRPLSPCAQHLFLGTVTWCSCLLDSICAGSIFTLGFSTLRKCSLKEWILPNRWDPFPVFPSISHRLVSSTPPKPSKERLELAVEQTCIQICLYHSQALCPSVRRFSEKTQAQCPHLWTGDILLHVPTHVLTIVNEKCRLPYSRKTSLQPYNCHVTAAHSGQTRRNSG